MRTVLLILVIVSGCASEKHVVKEEKTCTFSLGLPETVCPCEATVFQVGSHSPKMSVGEVSDFGALPNNIIKYCRDSQGMLWRISNQ